LFGGGGRRLVATGGRPKAEVADEELRTAEERKQNKVAGLFWVASWLLLSHLVAGDGVFWLSELLGDGSVPLTWSETGVVCRKNRGEIAEAKQGL